MSDLIIPEWPYAYGGPCGTGTLRELPEDFAVTEQLSFEPSGEGEHVFVYLQKTSENTDFIARQLARWAGVRQRDIGYAGLKDRHAVAKQWFSIWLPGKAIPDWTELESERLQILQVIRHARKLKRGVLAANEFTIRIRHWQGDLEQTNQQLLLIQKGGVPNYFGAQRFGNAGQNVQKALEIFQGAKIKPEIRSIYLSALRSYLFNQVLAARVKADQWHRAISGDAFMFEGSKAYFKSAQLDESILQRVEQVEIHPTGPLWGVGDSEVVDAASALETVVLSQFPELCQGLEQQKLAMARRSLRLIVHDLTWQWLEPGTLELSFRLQPGSFATSVLREIIHGL